MTLKRQLLLVSLLALMLPWAGCKFIRETESALRNGQQQMLAGTARALASTMSTHTDEYPDPISRGQPGEQLFIHVLDKAPTVDGFFDDWLLSERSLKTIRGAHGLIRLAIASYGSSVYLYVDVPDRSLVYATGQTNVLGDEPRYADRVALVSNSPPYREDQYVFAAEAPGTIISYIPERYDAARKTAIEAYWQDIPGGYRLEARIPTDLLGTHLGLVVSNASNESQVVTRSSTFTGQSPPAAVIPSAGLAVVADRLAQTGTRIILTDASGWRIASGGMLSAATLKQSDENAWANRIYDLLVEGGEQAASAEPDPSGREQQPYVSAALDGREMAGWFRGEESGRAIVAVAAPVLENGDVLGAIIVQQGTDAILSLTNEGLARLINLTLIATILVAGALVGYSSWLSRRIRHLSVAAEDALLNGTLQSALPSALAVDEIGDLSRSFSSVLRQLGDYNAYLRSLASKLSHELRTPLAIVTSSLENLEHEPLNDASLGYTTRAREGADRLRRILSAMSEASRVEELMEHADPEVFDLRAVLQSTVSAYRDVYKNRNFGFECALTDASFEGSPELLIQMLDKLVDNAVEFSAEDDSIELRLDNQDGHYLLSVTNPGPPLPDKMRTQLFDSMVSVRGGESSRHLGLGLYVAKLIAEGHSGGITADNVDGGVRFEVQLPNQDSR